MPRYELRCEKCRNEWEMNCSVNDIAKTDVRTCKKCGSNNTKILINSVNFQLKGGGWAKDGYSK